MPHEMIKHSSCHDLAPRSRQNPSCHLPPTPRPGILLYNQTRSPCDDITASYKYPCFPDPQLAHSSTSAPPPRDRPRSATKSPQVDDSWCSYSASGPAPCSFSSRAEHIVGCPDLVCRSKANDGVAFQSQLSGAEHITVQCQNCGNFSGRVMKRWYVQSHNRPCATPTHLSISPTHYLPLSITPLNPTYHY